MVNPQHHYDADTAQGVHVMALGLVIHLKFDDHLDEHLRQQVREAWSGAMVATRSEPAATITVVPGPSPEKMMESLSTQVTIAALEASQGEMLAFHAAGIALDDGRVIAFVGPSGRGKTTLVRTLGRHHGYVSDETVVVDASRTVHAYRKPLSLVREQGPKRQVAPDAEGLLNLPVAPLRLAALVLLDRDHEATDVVIERVPLLEAMTQLMPETSYLATLDSPLQQLARLCQHVGGVQRMTYQDVTKLPAAVEHLLQPGKCEESWTAADEVFPTSQNLQIGDISDAIYCSGELAVFSNQMLWILGGIAPDIWDAVRAGKSFEEIVQIVVERHGAPDEGDAEALVAEAIDALVGKGLLCRAE